MGRRMGNAARVAYRPDGRGRQVYGESYRDCLEPARYVGECGTGVMKRPHDRCRAGRVGDVRAGSSEVRGVRTAADVEKAQGAWDVRDVTVVPAARVGSLDRVQLLLRDVERPSRAVGRLGACPPGSLRSRDFRRAGAPVNS